MWKRCAHDAHVCSAYGSGVSTLKGFGALGLAGARAVRKARFLVSMGYAARRAVGCHFVSDILAVIFCHYGSMPLWHGFCQGNSAAYRLPQKKMQFFSFFFGSFPSLARYLYII